MPIFMTIQEQVDHMIDDHEDRKTVALTKTRFPVVEFGGRWFITIGNPGFNSPANNGNGFKSEGRAWAAIRRCGGPGWADRVTVARA